MRKHVIVSDGFQKLEVQEVTTTTRLDGGRSRHAYFVKDRIGSINHNNRSSEPFEALHALFRGDQLPGYPRSSRVVTAPRQVVANAGDESLRPLDVGKDPTYTFIALQGRAAGAAKHFRVHSAFLGVGTQLAHGCLSHEKQHETHHSRLPDVPRPGRCW